MGTASRRASERRSARLCMHRLRRRRGGLRGRGHQVLVHLVRRCVRRLLLVALHAGAHVLVVGGAAVGAAVGESMMSRHSCTVCSRVADATSRAVALVRVGEAWVRRRDRRGRRHRCLSGLARATVSGRSSGGCWPGCARCPCMSALLPKAANACDAARAWLYSPPTHRHAWQSSTPSSSTARKPCRRSWH